MNTMRITSFAVAVLLAAGLFASCEMVTCVKGAGDVVKKDLSVSGFHGIDVTGAIDVQLTRSNDTKVTVEGQANVIDLLETRVSNGVWTITTRECYSTDKPFIVHISVPMIDHVSMQGSGDITGTDAFDADAVVLSLQGSGDIKLAFNAKTVHAEVQGSGDIAVTGTTTEIDCSVQGSGDVKAADLKADRAKARVTGSGDVNVNVTSALDASVTGSGDVKYRGNPPQVKSNVTGSGEVAPMK